MPGNRNRARTDNALLLAAALAATGGITAAWFLGGAEAPYRTVAFILWGLCAAVLAILLRVYRLIAVSQREIIARFTKELKKEKSSMSSWTHALCDSCWSLQKSGAAPVRVDIGDGETCCQCGHPTRSGIYVRKSPYEIRCAGFHD